MGEPRVYFVYLRRPKFDRNERRDDPFYEFGSFGCTGCHSSNLLHLDHAKDLEGARLAFVQGGPRGARLVLLTPPVAVRRWSGHCELRWQPPQMPFKYQDAPILACNDGPSDFRLVARFARRANRATIEAGLASLLRSRATPLLPKMADQVIRVYERLRSSAAPSTIASKYHESLPYLPPRIDGNRKATYRDLLRDLKMAAAEAAMSPCSGAPSALPPARGHCPRPNRRVLVPRKKRCR
jgi:hypothetical protein